MPIHYYLRPNPLPGRELQFMSQVVSVDTIDDETLVERIAADGKTGLDRAAIEKVVNAINSSACALLSDGYRVSIAGLVQLFPVMNGKFAGPEDDFDRKRHELGVAAAVAPRLVEEVRKQAVVEKQKPTDQTPTPTFYKESGSQTAPGKVISGNIGTLLGRRIALNPQKSDEGIFFISTSDESKQVRVKVYAVVQPTEIVFQVPEGIGAGKWILEVRARVRGGKQVRSGRLSAPLEGVKRGP